jgi:sigma-B regulation protein RsbU (phosphoserine phosphatase)
MGISGDCLDVFQVGEDRLVFYLLDVSGHGITAALRSSAISQLLRPISGIMDGLIEYGPGHVMSKLNRHLCEGNRDVDYFATLVMGEIDAATGLLRLSSAGHPPALLLKEGAGATQIGTGGLPLGIKADAIYNQESLRLDTADALLLYSDGLLDCQDRQGLHYGLEPLKKDFELHNGPDVMGSLAKIEAGVDAWRGTVPLSDDLSLLLLRYSPDTLHSTPKQRDMTLCLDR